MLGFGLAIILCSVQKAQAQFSDPPTGPCFPICDPDTGECPPVPPECIPIDGGLAFLLAAGLGYGVLKNRSSNRKEQNLPPETAAN